MTEEKNWRICVVGNIVATHPDEDGILRYGTKAFTGGTKVYLFGYVNAINYGEMLVIGLNRFHRYAIECIPMKYIENDPHGELRVLLRNPPVSRRALNPEQSTGLFSPFGFASPCSIVHNAKMDGFPRPL